MLALKLSLVEFLRSCSRRAPGGRDFFWMTLLMFFVQLLALLILSAREGVLDRSVDAFLGNRPGYGIPVWTLPNNFGENEPVMITNELVGEVRDSGYYGAPFRRVENLQLIRMPDNNVWTASRGAGGGLLSGMAADFSGPLYPTINRPPTEGSIPPELQDAWDIVLDENIFRRYFNLEAYRESLQGRIPDSQFAAIPESIENLTDMSVIWLHVRVYRREVLTPFKVTWAEYFGIGATNTAFIIPIEMFNGFLMAGRNPNLCVVLDGGPQLKPRVLNVKSGRVFQLSLEEKSAFTEELKRLGAPIGGHVQQRGSRIMLDFLHGPGGGPPPGPPGGRNPNCDGGAPNLLFHAYLAESGMVLDPGQIETAPPTPGMELTANSVSGPCGAFAPRSAEVASESRDGGICIATVPVADFSTGYPEMLMYAEDRLQIKSLVDFMSCRDGDATQSSGETPNLCLESNEAGKAPESRLMINQIYEDSLTRFGFLTELLRAISGPIGLSMLLMLVAILWVQLGTVLGHRKIRYAMLLSNGMSWRQVRLMVVAQACMGVCLSLAFAYIVFIAAKILVLNRMSGITNTYEMITLGNPIDVLPVNPVMVAIVFIATLITAVVLTIMQMRLIGLSPRRALDRLLH